MDAIVEHKLKEVFKRLDDLENTLEKQMKANHLMADKLVDTSKILKFLMDKDLQKV